MKRIVMLFCMVALTLAAIPIYAQNNKVVVIPLLTNKSPGDWKTVSVSSMGGIPRTSSQTTYQAMTCTGTIGRYATSGGGDYLTVPIQLPDGATITSFTAVICDNSGATSGTMYLYRSESSGEIASVGTTSAEQSTTAFKKTTSTINATRAVVDNSQYSYYIYMPINGIVGTALVPISGIVTLQ